MSKFPDENPYNIDYDNYLDTSACTECTGLIPTPAVTPEQCESYREIFNFLTVSPDPPGSDDSDGSSSLGGT